MRIYCQLLFLFFVVTHFSSTAIAQSVNTSKSNKNLKTLTLSNGKYDETFVNDSLEQIGSVKVNRYTRKIAALHAEGSRIENGPNRKEQSRFLSVDPIAKKYAELSPYQYASNRPVEGVDLDGLEFMAGVYDYKNALYIGNLTAPKDKQLTQSQLDQWGNAMNEGDRLGKLAGLGISIDLFTGGKISQFLFYSELFSTFEHNKAKTTTGMNAQTQREREAFSNSFLTFGYGKLLEAGFIATKEAIPLFRGTTEKYPGNSSLQKMGITPTSTDPAVATIMATEADNYGKGIVYVTNTSVFSKFGVSENVLAQTEGEVGIVDLPPAQFPGYATNSLTPAEARGILKGMGISIPTRIKNIDLDRVLLETRKMTPDEIKTFVKKAAELHPPK